ncbi:MAG: asparagine synthase (glutamine-hydrolyzing) [Betaproteobacteria bacterium]|nr:asparagine synthase (glutamine-hydrolyzing) [Betaproteobacteria bacterium]
MCGIAGIFARPNEAAVRQMVAAMHHRGPDDTGLYRDNSVVLGQARLAIIDTTAGGHQPMASADGLVQIVYNGELYNHQAERSQLESRGHRFRTASDTEVVLKLYEEFGAAFLERLRGIFALAIYDKRDGHGAEKLLLARDQFGVKPLLYADAAGSIVFASELKAILSSGLIARRVDSESLRQLLSLGSVYQPATLVEGVRALPSAHYLLIDRRGSRLLRYWSYGLDRIGGLRQSGYAEQVERFGAVLAESVKLQMVADVPVGAFLSGGVDSSLIVALMARESGGHVKTFSVGFEDDVDAVDESHEAAVIARHLGTDHARVLVASEDIGSHLERFVVGLDQPSVDGLNSYFVSHAAAKAVTVSLSGTGADELLLGYPWFANVQNALAGGFAASSNSRQGNWARLHSFIARLGREGNTPRIESGMFREVFGNQYHCFGPQAAHGLLAAGRRSAVVSRSFADELAPCDELADGALLDRASVLCLNGYTRNQLLRDIDACSMAHSLEVRVPFLDVELADFAFSLPVSSKLAMNPRTLDPAASYTESGVKRVICDVARKYLPREFFDHRAKRGFSLPYADWLRGPMSAVLEDTLSWNSVEAAGLFDPAMVRGVHVDFLEGRRPWNHPWLLMVTELWRRNVLRH